MSVYLAEKRCSEDESLDRCSVCLEHGANYYLFHGETAHKCVCATCAIKISIKANPRCPICREDVSLIADSAPKTENKECSCEEGGCSSVVLLAVDHKKIKKVGGKTYDQYKATVECTTCTLEKEKLKLVGDAMVYKLYK